MSAVMKSASGTLVVIRSSEGAGQAVISLPGFPPKAAIYTSFGMSDRAAYQVSPTIGGPNYIYSFGQELSEITISLVTYSRSCDNSSGGLSSIIAYYQANRFSSKKPSPLSITLEGKTIKAFLVGMTSQVSAETGLALGRAQLQLLGWVDPATLGSEGGLDSLFDTISGAIGGVGGSWVPDGSNAGNGLNFPQGSLATLDSVWAEAREQKEMEDRFSYVG